MTRFPHRSQYDDTGFDRLPRGASFGGIAGLAEKVEDVGRCGEEGILGEGNGGVAEGWGGGVEL
jgi:hypothetical protein